MFLINLFQKEVLPNSADCFELDQVCNFAIPANNKGEHIKALKSLQVLEIDASLTLLYTNAKMTKRACHSEQISHYYYLSHTATPNYTTKSKLTDFWPFGVMYWVFFFCCRSVATVSLVGVNGV